MTDGENAFFTLHYFRSMKQTFATAQIFLIVFVMLHRHLIKLSREMDCHFLVIKEELMMYQTDCEVLRRGGCTENEIECLKQLRQEYMTRGCVQALAKQRRLEFVRWLFTIGKLSEHNV